jgi:drug/metabolite transporter, DME family
VSARATSGRAVGTIAVLAAAVLWSTTGTASHYRPSTASSLSVGAARIVFGGLLLLGWGAARGELRPVLAAPRKRLLLVGAVAVAGYQLAFFTAVARTGVAVGTVVAIGSAPVLAAVLDRATRGTPLTARWAAATGAAVTGGCVLVLGGASAGVDLGGVGLALLSGMGYGSYAVIGSTLIGEGLPSTGVMAAMFGLAGVLLTPVLLLSHPGWLGSPRGMLVVAELAVLATAVAYPLYGVGLRTVPVAVASTLGLAEPASAAVLGLVLLREPARASTFAGLALIGLALAVLTAPQARKR